MLCFSLIQLSIVLFSLDSVGQYLPFFPISYTKDIIMSNQLNNTPHGIPTHRPGKTESYLGRCGCRNVWEDFSQLSVECKNLELSITRLSLCLAE